MNLAANMVMGGREEEVDPALVNPRVQAFRADFNAYNPTFKGVPEGYVPKPWYEWLLDVLLLLPLYAFCGLAMYGCVSWGVASPASYGWSMVGLACAFIAVLLALCYVFAPRRRKIEREFIDKKIREQKEETAQLKAQQQKTQEMLAAYRAGGAARASLTAIPA